MRWYLVDPIDLLDTGAARRGDAGRGRARQGKVNAPLTGRGFDPVPLKARRGGAWRGKARQWNASISSRSIDPLDIGVAMLGSARHGKAGHGTARQGKVNAPIFSRSIDLLNIGEAGRGMARQCTALQGNETQTRNHQMTHTPTDLDGNPYTPILNYGWMTDAHRAVCAKRMECDPSQIEFRLDARAKMDALIIERCEEADPYGYERSRY